MGGRGGGLDNDRDPKAISVLRVKGGPRLPHPQTRQNRELTASPPPHGEWSRIHINLLFVPLAGQLRRSGDMATLT